MRLITIFTLVYLMIVVPGIGQDKKPSNHIGINGIPIFDVLNSYPDNQINGSAITFNYGVMVSRNLSFGVNLYYSGVSNEYVTESLSPRTERQQINVVGISPNLRYHYRIREKLMLYAQASIGFGNYREKTTDLNTSQPRYYKNDNDSMIMTMAGLGMNYFFSEKIALDLNVSYVYLNRLSSQRYVYDFQTIAPMIGIQFYW